MASVDLSARLYSLPGISSLFDIAWQTAGDVVREHYEFLQLIFFVFVVFWYLWPLLRRLYQLNRESKEIAKILDGGAPAEEARKHMEVEAFKKVLWARSRFDLFLRTWKDARSPGEERAVVSISLKEYLSPDIVIEGAANQRTSEALPGILLALGIFGTFLGLVYGLGGIRLHDVNPEEMMEGVKNLMDGLSLAFRTSLWGIFYSVCFTFMHKYFLRRLKRIDHKIDDAISNLYPCQSAELFTRKLIEITRDLKHGIQTLATDIATKLTGVLEPAMDRAVSAHLAPIMESLRVLLTSNIEELTKKNELMKDLFADKLNDINQIMSEHLEQVRNKQSEALKEILDQHVGEMSGAFKTQVHDIAQIIQQTTEAQTTIREEMIRFGNQLQEQFRGQGELIEKTSQAGRILGESLDSLGKIAVELRSSAGDITAAAELLADSAGKAKEGHETLKEVIERQVQAMAVTKDQLENSWKMIANNMSSVVEHVRDLVDEMARTLGDNLSGALETFDKSLAEVVERFSGTLLETNDTIEELPTIISNLGQSVSSIASDIQEHKNLIINLKEVTQNLVAPNIDKASEAANTLSRSVDVMKETAKSMESVLIELSKRQNQDRAGGDKASSDHNGQFIRIVEKLNSHMEDLNTRTQQVQTQESELLNSLHRTLKDLTRSLEKGDGNEQLGRIIVEHSEGIKRVIKGLDEKTGRVAKSLEDLVSTDSTPESKNRLFRIRNFFKK